MLENPPPLGNLVTALSSSFFTFPVRVVAPTVVRYGQDAGKSGLKTVPPFKHPLALSSPAGPTERQHCVVISNSRNVYIPATPESPEATRMEIPCMPSFMNSLHCLCW